QLIDWQDAMLRKGKVSSYQASASGGTDLVKYFVSGDYLDQQGIMVGTGYQRIAARANVEVQANKRLRFGLNIAPSYGITNGSTLADGKDTQTHLMLSFSPVTEATYGLHTGEKTVGQYLWGKSGTNPYSVMTGSTDVS